MKRLIALLLVITVLLVACAPQAGGAAVNSFAPPPKPEDEQEWELVTHEVNYSPAYYVIADTAAGGQTREIMPEHTLYSVIKDLLSEQPEASDTTQGDFAILTFEADGSKSAEAFAVPEQGEWYEQVFALYNTALTEKVVVSVGEQTETFYFETHSAEIFYATHALHHTLEQQPMEQSPASTLGYTVSFYNSYGCCLIPYTVTQTDTLSGDQRYPDAGLYGAINALFTHTDCDDCLHH